MRYKDFYVRITPDKYIPRVDKKGNKILCEGFLIQIFAYKMSRTRSTILLLRWGLRYWRTVWLRRCSLRRILWSVRGRSISRLLSKIYRD